MILPVARLWVILNTFALAAVSLLECSSSYFSALTHYFDFRGTCSRSDFVCFLKAHLTLFVWGFSLCWAFHDHSHMHEISIFSSVAIVLYFALTLIPGISMAIRRYRDVGKPWYWMLVPIVGLVLLFQPGASAGRTYEIYPSQSGKVC